MHLIISDSVESSRFKCRQTLLRFCPSGGWPIAFMDYFRMPDPTDERGCGDVERMLEVEGERFVHLPELDSDLQS